MLSVLAVPTLPAALADEDQNVGILYKVTTNRMSATNFMQNDVQWQFGIMFKNFSFVETEVYVHQAT